MCGKMIGVIHLVLFRLCKGDLIGCRGLDEGDFLWPVCGIPHTERIEQIGHEQQLLVAERQFFLQQLLSILIRWHQWEWIVWRVLVEKLPVLTSVEQSCNLFSRGREE